MPPGRRPSRHPSGRLALLGPLLLLAATPLLAQQGSRATPRALTRPYPLRVAGEIIPLQAGQLVTVIGQFSDQAVVEVILPVSGLKATGQLPSALLAAPPPPAAAPSAAPLAVENAAPLPAVPSPTPTPVLASAAAPPPPGVIPTEPGWHTLKLNALPAPPQKPDWFPYNFDAAKEDFEIYVPRGYRPGRPCPLLGWINPDDGLDAPHKFEALYDRWQIIVVTAARCGNNQATPRRIGLLTCAALELAKTLSIDQKRRVLGGFSGGSKAGIIGCFVQPETWSGAVCWCGPTFYKNWPASDRPSYHWNGFPATHHNPDAVSAASVSAARMRSRFALLTGLKDSNLTSTRDLDRAMRADGFKARLIVEPELGHAVGAEDSMRQALEFLLGPAAVPGAGG